ncbi:MAG: GNAT family N-acetyltransferase [Anaerolineaceae bacterium]|nr:GNAT family N-acetyltransferase [Anaerolineaceae bacterium]
MYEIMPARWQDLKELRHLEQICFDRDAWPWIELLAVLIFPGTVCVKAVVSGKMVGFVAGDVRKWQRVGWIATIGVLPVYRRMGIAKALLAACEEQMRMPTVRLCVRQSNLSAQFLYRREGYHQIEIWKDYYSGKENAIVFEKKGLT